MVNSSCYEIKCKNRNQLSCLKYLLFQTQHFRVPDVATHAASNITGTIVVSDLCIVTLLNFLVINKYI